MTLREELAQYSHDQAWAGWMRYMFDYGTMNEDGSWTMHPQKVERWKRQMETPYAQLTEQERKSDLDEAEKMLAIMNRYLGMGGMVAPKVQD
jgi:hypothetical protein